MVEIFIEHLSILEQYVTPEEFAQFHTTKEGGEFTLIRVNILSKTTYRMVQGKLMPTSMQFPEIKN